MREKEKGMKGWERREVRKAGGVAYRHFFVFEPWYRIHSSRENP